MRVVFEVEDRDLAYVIFDVESALKTNPTFWLSEVKLEGVCFDDMFDEEKVVWLEHIGGDGPVTQSHHRVVPIETVDYETVYDTDWVPVPVPVPLFDYNEYQNRYLED